jgi:hypothetical protein
MQLSNLATFRVWVCTIGLVVLGTAAPAADEKPKAKSDSKTTPDPTAVSAGSGLTTFGRQIPAQRPNLGIYIPSFSEGKKSSLVEAEVLTRIDDSRLQAEDMTIQLFGADTKDDVTVKMPSATYNMSNQILRSNERSKVSRSDFDLEGDALIFDTTSSQGRMSGNVRMTIHDVSTLMKKPEPAAKAAPQDPQTSTAPDAPAKPTPATPAPSTQAKP